MFCPECGCQTSPHDRLITMGRKVIAHCSGHRPCWKNAGTEFLEEVIRHVSREVGT